jgi:hypothetical protein
MAKVQVKRSSWLKLSPGVKGQGGTLAEQTFEGRTFTYFELPEYPDIPDQDDDILHVVTNGDRPDKLATTFYNEPRLWWVIAVKNGWDQPVTSLNPGEEIVIPSPRYVREKLVR